MTLFVPHLSLKMLRFPKLNFEDSYDLKIEASNTELKVRIYMVMVHPV